MCCGLKEVKVPLFKNSIHGINSSLDVICPAKDGIFICPYLVILDKQQPTRYSFAIKYIPGS